MFRLPHCIPIRQLIDEIFKDRTGALAGILRLVAVNVGVIPVQVMVYFVCTGLIMGLSKEQVRVPVAACCCLLLLAAACCCCWDFVVGVCVVHAAVDLCACTRVPQPP